MTNVCDCVTPTTTRCDCHATEHEFHDPRPEDEQPPKSLYDIPTGCICQGDGLIAYSKAGGPTSSQNGRNPDAA